VKYSFKARITFLSPEEGGRKTPCGQGYRPGFKYEDDPNHAWMIFPRFLDESGAEVPDGALVPKESDALMFILDDELRKTVHQERIKPGVRFFLMEGPRIVAKGVVTAILDLFDP
jgi:translation elongation factor EF-Tu-like GTPase